MTTLNRRQLAPSYPTYKERGYKPLEPPFGPPDMWPSGPGPGYSVYAGAHGRNLAGVDSMNSEGLKYYPNELDSLAEQDDIYGNGMFDPPGTHGNVHPDAGVFADHLSLPGDIHRTEFYKPSEVNDLVGGGQTMYVPGGAVAWQQGQAQTLKEKQLFWEVPPGVSPLPTNNIGEESTWLAPTATDAIGQAGQEEIEAEELLVEEEDKTTTYAVAIGAGLLLGGIGAYLWKRSK